LAAGVVLTPAGGPIPRRSWPWVCSWAESGLGPAAMNANKDKVGNQNALLDFTVGHPFTGVMERI
jgi:hypothetical protein